MESLALLVAIFVAISFVGGPVSVLLSFLPQTAAKVGAVFFAACSAAVSVYLLVVSSAIGGRLFAVFGLATSGFALWRVFTARRRTPHWDAGSLPPLRSAGRAVVSGSAAGAPTGAGEPAATAETDGQTPPAEGGNPAPRP